MDDFSKDVFLERVVDVGGDDNLIGAFQIAVEEIDPLLCLGCPVLIGIRANVSKEQTTGRNAHIRRRRLRTFRRASRDLLIRESLDVLLEVSGSLSLVAQLDVGLDVVHASIAGGDPRLGGLIDAERDLRGLENDEVRQPGYSLEDLALGISSGDYLLEDGFDPVGALIALSLSLSRTLFT